MKIKVSIINNMDSYKSIGDAELDDKDEETSQWKNEVNKALDNEVNRLQKILIKQRDNSDL